HRSATAQSFNSYRSGPSIKIEPDGAVECIGISTREHVEKSFTQPVRSRSNIVAPYRAQTPAAKFSSNHTHKFQQLALVPLSLLNRPALRGSRLIYRMVKGTTIGLCK